MWLDDTLRDFFDEVFILKLSRIVISGPRETYKFFNLFATENDAEFASSLHLLQIFAVKICVTKHTG